MARLNQMTKERRGSILKGVTYAKKRIRECPNLTNLIKKVAIDQLDLMHKDEEYDG